METALLGLIHQGVIGILVLTEDYVSLRQLSQLLHRSQTWKKDLAVTQAHLVCAVSRAHLSLLKVETENISATNFFPPLLVVVPLPSSIFRFWECNQQP